MSMPLKDKSRLAASTSASSFLCGDSKEKNLSAVLVLPSFFLNEGSGLARKKMPVQHSRNAASFMRHRPLSGSLTNTVFPRILYTTT